VSLYDLVAWQSIYTKTIKPYYMVALLVLFPVCLLTLCTVYLFLQLPPKLGLLKNLWKLDLELCPLEGVIQDLLHSSRYPVKDILGFLLSILEE
jgi:hypothetical protein